jgi:hypothetical protein
MTYGDKRLRRECATAILDRVCAHRHLVIQRSGLYESARYIHVHVHVHVEQCVLPLAAHIECSSIFSLFAVILILV